MAIDDEIARAINELHENRSSRDCQNIIILCNSIIQEAREDNDTAPRIRVLRNQGKIAGLSELISVIMVGNPSNQKNS